MCRLDRRPFQAKGRDRCVIEQDVRSKVLRVLEFLQGLDRLRSGGPVDFDVSSAGVQCRLDMTHLFLIQRREL